MDIEYLTKVCSEYSTDDLLRRIFVESQEFVPEAIEVFQKEVERRESDLELLLKTESETSGVVVQTILNTHLCVEDFETTVTGCIYLTSKGIYFIPEEIVKKKNSLYGVGYSFLGPLGLIIDEIGFSMSQEERHVQIDSRLPLSLLARVLEHSFGALTQQIKHVEYKRSGVVSFATLEGEESTLLIDKKDIDEMVSWMIHHSIAHSRKRGLIEKLLGR